MCVFCLWVRRKGTFEFIFIEHLSVSVSVHLTCNLFVCLPACHLSITPSLPAARVSVEQLEGNIIVSRNREG